MLKRVGLIFFVQLFQRGSLKLFAYNSYFQHLKFFQPFYDVNGFIAGHLRTAIRAYASFPGVIYSCASNYMVYLDNSATSEGSGVPLASVQKKANKIKK